MPRLLNLDNNVGGHYKGLGDYPASPNTIGPVNPEDPNSGLFNLPLTGPLNSSLYGTTQLLTPGYSSNLMIGSTDNTLNVGTWGQITNFIQQNSILLLAGVAVGLFLYKR